MPTNPNLITHIHPGQGPPETAERTRNKDAAIASMGSVTAQKEGDARLFKSGDAVVVERIRGEVAPAHSRAKRLHPQVGGGAGYTSRQGVPHSPCG